MLVHFVTDEPSKIPAIRAVLGPQYDVVPRLLGGDGPEVSADGVLMVDADLRKMVRAEQVKLVMQGLSGVPERLFVVPQHLRSMIAQAYALGATAVVSRPREIIVKLEQIEVAAKAAQTDAANSNTPPQIAETSTAFAAMFSAARSGKPIKFADAERATSQVIDSITENGLSTWLDEVRRCHEGTFQHCLMVTGVAIGFAIDIGFSNADVKRLGIAATLHDIGKAHIPLSILDKPGALDARETVIMKRHPAIGFELLKDLPEISAEILDGVRHHHEYLDGSGYPDALKAPDISDLVRLLTISDIFAALIESRPYRPAMSRQNAYKILCDMDGKLEGALIKAFRNIALIV
jgi:putative nucleotidyltransferase with HDIG domain